MKRMADRSRFAAAPAGDQEVHRDEHGLEGQEEQHQVEHGEGGRACPLSRRSSSATKAFGAGPAGMWK